MDITRRKFLKVSMGAASTLLAYPLFLPARAATGGYSLGRQKILVIVRLAGGNDGLNTVIPYGAGAYYQRRPTLALKAEEVHSLNGQLGLHSSMAGMSDLYKDGKLAIILGAGYPDSSRSHFRATEIWQTADPEKIAETGWLGRYLDLLSPATGLAEEVFPAVNLDPAQSKLFSGSKVMAASVIDTNLKIASNHNRSDRVNYPDDAFARKLKLIAEMVSGGAGPHLYNVSLEGFDTHANQNTVHPCLLKQLSNGLAAFQADLEQRGVAQDVLVMTYSEFGRRLQENGARGTDHGTAAPLFIMGSSLAGGIYGDYPNPAKLDLGDLRHSIDFRNVYATLLDRWLAADSQEVLGSKFDCLAFL